MVSLSSRRGKIPQNHKHWNTKRHQMSIPMIRNDTILEGSQPPPSRSPPTDQLFRRFTPDQVTQYPTSDISNRSLTSVNVFTADPDIKRAHIHAHKEKNERENLFGRHCREAMWGTLKCAYGSSTSFMLSQRCGVDPDSFHCEAMWRSLTAMGAGAAGGGGQAEGRRNGERGRGRCRGRRILRSRRTDQIKRP